MTTEDILIVLEVLGTVAFAISGALVAIKVKYDIFGVSVIGVVTAVGGGIMLDLIIGEIPPAIFTKFYIVLIARIVLKTLKKVSLVLKTLATYLF
jgi:uncharacterized membrane protein YeiH